MDVGISLVELILAGANVWSLDLPDVCTGGGEGCPFSGNGYPDGFTYGTGIRVTLTSSSSTQKAEVLARVTAAGPALEAGPVVVRDQGLFCCPRGTRLKRNSCTVGTGRSRTSEEA